MLPKMEMAICAENRLLQLPLGDATATLENLRLEGLQFDRQILDITSKPYDIEYQVRSLLPDGIAGKILPSLRADQAKLDLDGTVLSG
mmetsp:Transcript_413/g.858  ORF Transcript_413/g.858 Transcript_413/m.858 type:complete len:88 (-) Transcript_413:247-510(-)